MSIAVDKNGGAHQYNFNHDKSWVVANYGVANWFCLCFLFVVLGKKDASFWVQELGSEV